jgi:hypothetical protein
MYQGYINELIHLFDDQTVLCVLLHSLFLFNQIYEIIQF